MAPAEASGGEPPRPSAARHGGGASSGRTADEAVGGGRLAACPVGIYEKALPKAEPPALLQTAADLGFDFLELSIDESDERLSRLSWSAQQRRGLIDAIYDTGIRVPSICLSGNRRFPIGSARREAVERGMALIHDAVDLAADIGVRNVQLAGYDVYYDEEPTPETAERFRANLVPLVDYAAGRGVMLSVEIMDTRFMSSISRFLHLRRRIPSPWLSVYPDLGNLSAWNDNPAEELELGLREAVVSAIHIKDTLAPRPGFPGAFRDVPFGEGCVDFPRLLSVLARYGYAGQFVIEMWNHGETDTSAIVRARDWFLQLLARA